MRIYDRVAVIRLLKIVALCTVAAVFYGIVHDQFTARICVEYFTVFHPPVFHTKSPTLLGIGWGIIATWWMGAILGILLAAAARVGLRPQLTVEALAPMVGRLLLVMAACAVAAGFAGYFWGRVPDYFSQLIPQAIHQRFLADWWAHSASYASGLIGGLTLCGIVYRKRRQLESPV